mmetsp:Transcript_81857/g.255617  ORF Transcript_81857/g.255617 Transcript_81857/m.255617 type:complete len:335 (+) Transcript_81857:162-1166(+)
MAAPSDAAKDSFWGSAAEAKGRAGGADVREEVGKQEGPAPGAKPPSSKVVETKTESQPVTPKRTEPPPVEKLEGKEVDDVFEDDEEDDDLLPEAQPSFPRNEVDKDKAAFRQNAVHVYGLDFLKTGHMDEIFSQFNHKCVEWINDSSANIIFADAASAKKAVESLSFKKAGDEPWRRTPDILVSEDVPPIFLQMRLAASSDIKPSRRSVPKAAPPPQYSAPRRGDQRDAARRRQMYSDGPGAEQQGRRATKRPGKAEISEEELLKRRKRALRFGTGGPEEKPRAVAVPAAPDAKTQDPGSAPGNQGSTEAGKPDPAPGVAVAPAEAAASSGADA